MLRDKAPVHNHHPLRKSGIVHQPLFEDLLVRARDAGITFCPLGELLPASPESLPLRGKLYVDTSLAVKVGWVPTGSEAPHDEIDTLLSGFRRVYCAFYYVIPAQ